MMPVTYADDRPPPRRNRADAAAEQLLLRGWCLGPVENADEWRTEVLAHGHALGLVVVTGIGQHGVPWAARGDLDDQALEQMGPPWWLMGLRVGSFFKQYPARPLGELAESARQKRGA